MSVDLSKITVEIPKEVSVNFRSKFKLDSSRYWWNMTRVNVRGKMSACVGVAELIARIENFS